MYDLWIIFVVVFQHLKLSTRQSSKSKTFSDSYVVYEHFDQIQYGCIQKIYFIEPQNNYLLKIKPLDNIIYDSLTIGSKIFVNEHIIFGTLSPNQIHLVSVNNIIEKGCFYETNETCYFARYPNMHESS